MSIVNAANFKRLMDCLYGITSYEWTYGESNFCIHQEMRQKVYLLMLIELWQIQVLSFFFSLIEMLVFQL